MHADADVDEPLPPADRVLSGLDGEFQAREDSAEEPEASSEAEEGGEEQEGKGGGEAETEKKPEEADKQEEEEEEPQPVIELKTASHDPRFPSTNQVLKFCVGVKN